MLLICMLLLGRFCDICRRYCSKTNKHCSKCDRCTTKVCYFEFIGMPQYTVCIVVNVFIATIVEANIIAFINLGYAESLFIFLKFLKNCCFSVGQFRIGRQLCHTVIELFLSCGVRFIILLH